ncbi:hypothetical protein DSO57_1015490 [Entomophthora muscae]|uniref:Uncharacterized protein n=1 Tax=Entomophthora muscae TaxID=34485 RepID=A0ACC2UFI3_9FUNG|nr:hypothetical protein DSO57_1015490 [Entomophthora muscae]
MWIWVVIPHHWETASYYSAISVTLHVRNIPDINQILTEEKCSKQVKKCQRRGAKFDREFPPLSGEKKNQNLEKTDFDRNQNILSSGQAPAVAAQTPAPLCQPPCTQPATRKPPASHPSAQAGTSGSATSPLPARQPPTSPLPGSCLPPVHPARRQPLPRRPAACPQATCPLPGPTSQPIKTHHDNQPIKKVPCNKGKFWE